jgi:hypothetical protein
MISERASIQVPSTLIRNGCLERSASATVPHMYSAPKRSACFFMFSTSSGPLMPSGKPGKFSTSVVTESCPPGSWPMITSGFSPARAV